MTSPQHAPTALPYDRRPAELLAQTDLLRATARGAGLTTPVPSCPGWNLGELLRHVGQAHRWADTIVRTRAQSPVSHAMVDDVSGQQGEDPAVLDAWLAEGAAALAESLGDAGPDAPVWTVAPGGTPVFWARRMTVETVIHRWDAANALGAPYELDPAVAYDALAEWMELSVLPQAFESEALMRGLLADGRTLHFAATDADTDAGFVADLSGAAPAWHRTTAEARPATTTLRGPLPALLLRMYGRGEAPDAYAGDVEILGDAGLFDTWRHRVGYWTRK